MSAGKVDDILQLVGGTPLVRLNRVGGDGGAQVYVKLEFLNPGGSIKDRAALRMIEQGERSGELTTDKIVLEATSGNTGIGLAMVCAVKGYRMLFTMAESASEERRKILRAYGAQLLLTPGHLGTDGAIEEAYRLAREQPERYFLVDQYNNEANWRAHYEAGTADEILEAAGDDLRVVVATMGTTGTVMGLARRMHERAPGVAVVGVEPYKGHKIQGLKNMKESYPPGIYDPRVPDRVVHVDDDAAYEAARRLARQEGIFVGMSAGAAVRVALDEAAALSEGTVVAVLPDGGERYLSTPLFVTESVPVPLRLYNTLTRQVDDLVPTRPGHVGIYACGPSLDGPPDLGLCRRMVFADTLRRYLEYRGFDVKLVVNVADVDDRTVSQCLAEGAKLDEFTARWEAVFQQDMRTLGVLPAHQQPRASQHVPDMIEVTRRLLDRGWAYEKLRSVYFDISRAPSYGKLSRVDLSSTRTDDTVDFDYYEKEHARDFTLFKRASLAELKAGIYWATPWGNVRPGWHVECATMACQHLGQPFDLHLASCDLMFPHGDNEIAIAESLTGQPFARMWLHSEVVTVGGKKVSRVLGNDVTLRQVLEQGYSPAAVRFWLMSQHHRRRLAYDPRRLAQVERAVQRLDDFVARLRYAQPGPRSGEVGELIHEARLGYHDAMDNDLNVAVAHSHIFGLVKQINRVMQSEGLHPEQASEALDFIRSVDRVLGVVATEREVPLPEIDALVRQRDGARARGDYAAADALRTALIERGVRVFDTPAGTLWRRV